MTATGGSTPVVATRMSTAEAAATHVPAAKAPAAHVAAATKVTAAATTVAAPAPAPMSATAATVSERVGESLLSYQKNCDSRRSQKSQSAAHRRPLSGSELGPRNTVYRARPCKFNDYRDCNATPLH